ncbi:hypothetical protein RFI_35525 [Reticulomyxa filosa]|uniref:RING-type domain-containing protein n=1 Tax=Reticulomyxa filosa TaxID=46433 RepID=X6LJ17_RETFI|nr:hypothetical protein RFI_35525 [Reticulomyxa filosa]|eukprot:ETO01913.1 hypothetical protein RFI_35525 [Reticulomyxa filosa]
MCDHHVEDEMKNAGATQPEEIVVDVADEPSSQSTVPVLQPTDLTAVFSGVETTEEKKQERRGRGGGNRRPKAAYQFDLTQRPEDFEKLRLNWRTEILNGVEGFRVNLAEKPTAVREENVAYWREVRSRLETIRDERLEEAKKLDRCARALKNSTVRLNKELERKKALLRKERFTVLQDYREEMAADIDDKVCAICCFGIARQPVFKGREPVKFSCGHLFHIGCATSVIHTVEEGGASCPLCRKTDVLRCGCGDTSCIPFKLFALEKVSEIAKRLRMDEADIVISAMIDEDKIFAEDFELDELIKEKNVATMIRIAEIYNINYYDPIKHSETALKILTGLTKQRADVEIFDGDNLLSEDKNNKTSKAVKRVRRVPVGAPVKRPRVSFEENVQEINDSDVETLQPARKKMRPNLASMQGLRTLPRNSRTPPSSDENN